ncbi:3-deoxy-7-phosphoheptulonate synthase, partial [Streptomyces spiralis]
MIVAMRPRATREQLDYVSGILRDQGLIAVSSTMDDIAMLITEQCGTPELVSAVEKAAGVDRVIALSGPQRLTSREFRAEDTVVKVGPSGEAAFGGTEFTVIAGPCAVEGRDQMFSVVDAVVAAGAVMVRGGAFKPRSSPYSFQGMGLAGLALLAEQRKRTGLPVVTEVVTPGDVECVAEESDMLQIGTRNMQNFELLREAGASGRPVLLKRGMSATIEEWLMAAEYVMQAGNGDVVLCERGIRSYDRSTRFTLDLSAVAEAKRLTHLPVIVDPSHSTGR